MDNEEGLIVERTIKGADGGVDIYATQKSGFGETFLGSPQEFVNSGILRGFPDFLKSDIFGVGNGHAACLQ